MQRFMIFDLIHLSWLIIITISLIISVICYVRSTHQKKWLKIIFWTLFISEVLKQLILYFTNEYTYWSPPLHLCGLGIFIVGWHVYQPNKYNATILFSLTLPGALIALIFPGWTANGLNSFLHYHSFIFHALLVAAVLLPLSTKQLHLAYKTLWISILFLVIIVPIIYQYNIKFDTNFMFLNAPVKNTPLQWLYDAFGSSGYLISLSVFMLIIWLFEYILLAFCRYPKH